MIRGIRLVVGLSLTCLGSHVALAKTCELAVAGDDKMQFDKKELTVGADCTEVKLTLKHAGTLPKSAMGHNWTLTKSADVDSVVAKSVSAGPQKDYLAADDKIIAHTKLLAGGESDTITFPVSKLKAGEDYTYFCTFPGHSSIMRGKLVFQGGGKAKPAPAEKAAPKKK